MRVFLCERFDENTGCTATISGRGEAAWMECSISLAAVIQDASPLHLMAAADLTLRVGLRGLPLCQPQPLVRTVQQIQHQQLPAQAGLAQQKLDSLGRLCRGGHTSREGQRALLVFLAVLGARVRVNLVQQPLAGQNHAHLPQPAANRAVHQRRARPRISPAYG